MNHRQEVDGELLEAGCDPAALLDPAHTLLDRMAPAIDLAIEPHSAIVGILVAAPRDHGPDRMAPQPLANAHRTVGLVPGQGLGATAPPDLHPVHDRFELRALVDLAGRDMDRERDSVT